MSTKQAIASISIAERRRILKNNRGLLADVVRELSKVKPIGRAAVSAAYWRKRGQRSASPRAEELLLMKIAEIRARERIAAENRAEDA